MKDMEGARTQLKLAQQKLPTIPEMYIIFSKGMDYKQKVQSHDVGDASMDLVDYVEFQSNLSQAETAHRETVRAIRKFWISVMQHHVPVVDQLSLIYKKIDSFEEKAQTTYAYLFNKYPKSIKVLKAYGEFLARVENNSTLSRNLFTQAGK